MDASVRNAIGQVIAVLGTYGLNVLGALVILVIGFAAAGWAARATHGALLRTKRVDETLRPFLASVVRYSVIVFTVLAVLERFGVQTTSFIAVLGAAGLAIGLAFQGTLGNIAAGIMLLIFRPFRVGQFVEVAGIAGTVEVITLFMTELNTPDNVHIVVPNGQLWGTAVKNYSHNSTRRADITIGIDYGDDIGKAFDIIKGVIDGDGRISADPPPEMMVTNLGDSAVELQLRLWCAAGDYWPLKFDLNRRLKEALDAGGITIPFPQRTVHLVKESGAN
jgi:small conductance mechanosensitive channel